MVGDGNATAIPVYWSRKEAAYFYDAEHKRKVPAATARSFRVFDSPEAAKRIMAAELKADRATVQKNRAENERSYRRAMPRRRTGG